MTASPPSAPRLPTENLLRRRVTDFARQIREVIDELDRPQRQQLLRLLIEDVHVTGYQAKIRLRIPLDPQTPARPGQDLAASRAITDNKTSRVKPKTVCVPSVATDGYSYRMREARAKGGTT